MKLRTLSLVAAACAVLFPACQQQQFEPYRGYKKAPYTLKGVRYVPMGVNEALNYREDGIASFYEADGARGAIGQRLYDGQFYAAHRTLPLPCHVRITNLSNGKSCKARALRRTPRTV